MRVPNILVKPKEILLSGIGLLGRNTAGDGESSLLTTSQARSILGGPGLTFSTVAAAEAAVFSSGDRCAVSETDTLYYYDQSSTKTRDGIFCLNTGGTGRLLAFQSPAVRDYIVKSGSYTILNSDPVVIYGNTDSAGFTLTLTASPIDGIYRTIKSIGTNGNNLTLARNGQEIERTTDDLIVTDGQSVTLQFITTIGWLLG